MKPFRWDETKNKNLKKERGLSFEDIQYYISTGHVVDITAHPNTEKYPHQRVFYINIENYIYYVPFVENDTEIFLKSIIPSRKYTKRYLGGKNNE